MNSLVATALTDGMARIPGGVFRMGADDGSCSTEYHHVAHFADCEHEVEEITAGNRLVAVYSLIWADDSPQPSAPDMEATSRLAAFLEQNMHNRTLGYLLTHQYTQQSLSNLGLRALKRRDRTIAGALLAASTMMRAGSPGNELVINIARMSQTNDRDCDFNPEIEFEEVGSPLPAVAITMIPPLTYQPTPFLCIPLA